MKRTIELRADSQVVDGGSGAIVPGTSPYPGSSTPGDTIVNIWNTGPIAQRYVYFHNVAIPSWGVGFEPGPTLARFTRVTITAGFDYAQTGPNNWWFPPDNAYGPRAWLFLRLRNLSSYQSGTGSAFYEVLNFGFDDHNVNMNTNPTLYKLRTLTWDMTAHPEGGPWTLHDINNLVAGVSHSTSNGPNGKPYDPSQGGFFRIRVPYLTVTLEVEDLGGDVLGPRRASSIALRLKRRARDIVLPNVSAEFAVGDVMMGRVYPMHPRGAAAGGGGWGPRRLERLSSQVTQRTILPEAFRVTDECFDRRRFDCLLWAAYRIDNPWSPELQGLSLIDKGRSFIHSRAQDGWSARPGDGNLMRVLEAFPNVSPEGLAVQGGGDVSIALRNYDLMQSGWSTVGSSGSFTVTADTAVAMVEEQGYLSSAKLDYGGGGGQGGRERSLGALPFASNDRLHVRVVLHNTEVPDPDTQNGEIYLKRSGGGLPAAEYWNETGRTWTTTATYISVPSSEAFGERILDAVPLNAALAGSNPTYVIAVGRFSANLSSVILHGALVDVQHSTSAVAGARTPLVTLDATITRVADVHTMEHVWGRELWVHERGVAVFEGRPFWRAVDLPADAVKPLLHAQHTATDWDALQFVPKTGTDDLIRFERALNGLGTYQLDCPILDLAGATLHLTRIHVLRAWARWLGPDGWKDYGPYSVEVGYAVFLRSTGELVGQGSVVGRLSSEVAVPTARDYVGIGCDETRFFDGWVRMVETRRNPIHRLEAVWQI